MRSVSLLLTAAVAPLLADPLELGAPQKISGGSFKATGYASPALADFNGDGLVDLALGGGGAAGIYLNRGAAKQPRFPDLDVPLVAVDGSIRALDFNRDGLMDLMIRDRVFLNFGSKTQSAFDTDWEKGQHAVNLKHGAFPQDYTFHNRAELCDLNGDGRADLILSVSKTRPLDTPYSARFVAALDEGQGMKGIFGVPRWLSVRYKKQAGPGVDPAELGMETEWTDHCPQIIFRDLSGDKKPEAFAGSYGGGVYPLAPVAEQSWLRAAQSLCKPKGLASAPDFADLNGDGLPDLVFGVYNGEVYVAWNHGTPKAPAFAEAELLRGGEFRINSYGMFDLADYDGDGLPDLLMGQGLVSSSIGGVQVFKNAGSRKAPEFQFDQSVKADEHLIFAMDGWLHSAPQLADIDGDGEKDLLVCAAPPEHPKGRVFVFFNRGGLPPRLLSHAPMESGPFVLKTGDDKPIEVERGYNARWADLDGDGLNDLVVGGPQAMFYKNTGRARHPVFREGQPLRTENDQAVAGLVAVGDLTGDKFPDLVAGDANTGAPRFYPNMGITGALQFGTAEIVEVNGEKLTYDEGVFPLIGDFNGDGKNDLAIGLLKSNRFYWFAGK